MIAPCINNHSKTFKKLQRSCSLCLSPQVITRTHWPHCDRHELLVNTASSFVLPSLVPRPSVHFLPSPSVTIHPLRQRGCRLSAATFHARVEAEPTYRCPSAALVARTPHSSSCTGDRLLTITVKPSHRCSRSVCMQLGVRVCVCFCCC